MSNLLIKSFLNDFYIVKTMPLGEGAHAHPFIRIGR